MAKRRSKSKRFRPKRTTSRRQTLAIVSAVILLLTFTVREMLKEWAKDVTASAQAGEDIFRTETGQSTLSLQMLQLNQQLSAMKRESTREAVEEQDYSDVIKNDLIMIQQVSAGLNVDVDSVSRLLEKLPFGAAYLRQELDQLKPNIEKAHQQVTEVLKPSLKHDLSRMLELKLTMITVLAQQLPVIVIGDQALT